MTNMDCHSYHFVVDLMEVDLAHFLHHVFILEGDKAKAWKTHKQTLIPTLDLSDCSCVRHPVVCDKDVAPRPPRHPRSQQPYR